MVSALSSKAEGTGLNPTADKNYSVCNSRPAFLTARVSHRKISTMIYSELIRCFKLRFARKIWPPSPVVYHCSCKLEYQILI